MTAGPVQADMPAEEWLSKADLMLYRSKSRGRNRVTGDEAM